MQRHSLKYDPVTKTYGVPHARASRPPAATSVVPQSDAHIQPNVAKRRKKTAVNYSFYWVATLVGLLTVGWILMMVFTFSRSSSELRPGPRGTEATDVLRP